MIAFPTVGARRRRFQGATVMAVANQINVILNASPRSRAF